MDSVTWMSAFLAGLLSFLSPCVLPMLPTYSLILAGTGERQIYRNSAAFLLGFTLVFILLGAAAFSLGQWLLAYQQEFRRAGAVVVLLFGIFLAADIKIPQLQREYRPFLQGHFSGTAGCFLLGMAFTFGWTPCVGPILAAILIYAGTAATVGEGVLLLLFYSMGFAIPFLLLAAAFRHLLPKIRGFYTWLPRLQRLTGVFLILLALLLWTDQLAKINRWLL